MSQRIISLKSGDLRLHGLVRAPDKAEARGVVLICDPFAEEKKCSHRPLVEIAWELAKAGFTTLRFDYRGCGDSEGSFGDFTPADWLADLEAAVEFARSDLGAAKIVLAGLRMGANLAVQLVRKRPDLARLVLWEPILDGKQYVAQNLRRSLVKAMLTSGEQFQAQKVTEAHAQAVVDFDGYLVRAEARAQLEALKLGDATVPFDGPALLVNIGPKDEPGEGIRRAAACFPKGEARGLRLEPFWNRIGLMDAGPLAKLTVEWLLA